MLENSFRYALEFFKPDGAVLGRRPADVDWEPALEWARFEAQRRLNSTVSGYTRVAVVQPLWSDLAGEPYVDGFIISFPNGPGAISPVVFKRTYFRPLASRLSSHFVKTGQLNLGDLFEYQIVAFPKARAADLAKPGAIDAIEVGVDLPVRMAEEMSGLETADTIGPVLAEDVPVLVPPRILDEIANQARAAGRNETGGFLIGYLCRSKESGDLFLAVTAQLKAAHAVAEPTRLTFTPATWTTLQATLKLRKRGEILLGWFHSHPAFAWCRECRFESRKRCRTAKDFFSEHDHLLHRTAFPQAYNVALVANVTGEDSAPDVTFSAFCWRQGAIALRGIHLIDKEIDIPTGEVYAAAQTR